VAALYDLLPDEVRVRYPLEALDEPYRSSLSRPLSRGYPASRAAQRAAEAAKNLPYMTAEYQAGKRAGLQYAGDTSEGVAQVDPKTGARRIVPHGGAPATVTPQPTDRAALLRKRNLASQFLVQAGVPYAEGLPRTFDFRERAAQPPSEVPEPAGLVQHAGRLTGELATFAGKMAVAEAAMAPAAIALVGRGAGAALTLGQQIARARALANPIAAGIAGAASAGSPRERAIAGVTTAGAARLTHVAGTVSRLSGAAAGAVTFGGLQPLAANVAERATARLAGEQAPPPITAHDIARGIGEMGVVNLLMGGGGGAPPDRTRRISLAPRPVVQQPAAAPPSAVEPAPQFATPAQVQAGPGESRGVVYQAPSKGPGGEARVPGRGRGAGVKPSERGAVPAEPAPAPKIVAGAPGAGGAHTPAEAGSTPAPTISKGAEVPAAPTPRFLPAEMPRAKAPPPDRRVRLLPRELAGAKPRYGYGAKQFELEFKSDEDKAAYIVAQQKKSKADAAYRVELMARGWTGQEMYDHGQRVKAAIKEMARTGDPEKGPLLVPEVPRATPPKLGAVTEAGAKAMRALEPAVAPEPATSKYRQNETVFAPSPWARGAARRPARVLGPGSEPGKVRLWMSRGKTGEVIEVAESAVRRPPKKDLRPLAEKRPRVYEALREKWKGATPEAIEAARREMSGTPGKSEEWQMLADIADETRKADTRPPATRHRQETERLLGTKVDEMRYAEGPGRVAETVERLRSEVADMAPEARSLLEPLLRQAETLSHEYRPERIAERVKAGESLEAIHAEVAKKMGPAGPNDWGGAMSVFGSGEISRAIGHLVSRNLRPAMERFFRTIPKRERVLRLADPHGNIRERLDMVEPPDDYIDAAVTRLGAASLRTEEPVAGEHVEDMYSNFKTMRTGAHMRLLGFDTVGEPKLRALLRYGQSRKMELEQEWAEKRNRALGPDGMRWATAHPVDANRAAEGKPSNAPEWFKERLRYRRVLLDEMREAAVEHAAKYGQEEPGYVTDFVSRELNGSRATLRTKAIKVLDGEVAVEEVQDRLKRMFDHRTGDDVYTEDLVENDNRYFRYLADRLGLDGFWQGYLDYKTKDQESIDKGARAGLIDDWVRVQMLRRKSGFEAYTDAGLRRRLFQNVDGGIAEVSTEVALEGAGASKQTIAAALKGSPWTPSDVDHYVIVPAETPVQFIANGQKFSDAVKKRLAANGRSPERIAELESVGHAVELGKTKWGARVFGILHGESIDRTTPKLKPHFERVVRARFEFGQKAKQKLAALRVPGVKWDPEVDGALAAIQQAHFERRLWSNPTMQWASFAVGNQLRALIGWNMRTAALNSANALITASPEYAFGIFAKAIRRAGAARGRTYVRNMLDFAEDKGWLTKEQVVHARKHTGVILDEMLARVASSEQGEAADVSREFERLVDGKNLQTEKLKDALGPFGAFSFAEGWQRTLDTIAADIYARRLGIPEGKLAEFRDHVVDDNADARAKAMQELLGDAADFRSRLAFLGEMGDLTQYNYGPRSKMWLIPGAMGKILSSLSTWPINHFFKQVLRPTEGFVRTGVALVRGLARSTVGKGMTPLPERGMKERGFVPRSRFAAPKGWFGKFLDANGANYAHRHAAAVLMRHIALSAFLVGIANFTGIAVNNLGVNPALPTLLTILGFLGLKGDRLKAWIHGKNLPLWLGPRLERMADLAEWRKRAWEGSTVSYERATVPGGPMIGGVVDIYKEMAAAHKRAEKADDMTKYATGGVGGTVAGAAAGAAVGGVLAGKPGVAGGAVVGALFGAFAFESTLRQVRRQLFGMLAAQTNLFPLNVAGGEVAVTRALRTQYAFWKAHPDIAALLGIKMAKHYESAADAALSQVGMLPAHKEAQANVRVNAQPRRIRVLKPRKAQSGMFPGAAPAGGGMFP
jgi:hypothetical protein